jgi:hypothetical protein
VASTKLRPTLIMRSKASGSAEAEVYLTNPTSQIIDVSGELFGFNTGSYETVPSTQAPAGTIPWSVASDVTFVALEKKVITISDTVYKAMSDQGIAELMITDHALKQRTHLVQLF